MSKHTDRRAPASTFLVHHFGRGLVDEGRTYAVERFVARADGDIRRWPLDAPATGNGRGRPVPEVATFEEVREMRPAYNEIIVCTALGTRSGRQVWGCNAIWGHMLRRSRFPR